MRYSRSLKLFAVIATVALLASGVVMFAQETTGGIQGTVKDSTGAVVGGAHVIVRGTTLAGDKTLDSESTGYYRFANLPPGVYSVEVSAKGFKTSKREGLAIEIGRLPTVDITLEVGVTSEVVEVSGQAPAIDVTTNTNQTNVTSDVLADVPHGYSFQSVIQFAPMARNEPLAGGSATMGAGGTGGSLPGSSGNGMAVGFSVGGAADSESTYLIEGQDTENISGGASQANVPFEFIQEVQVKTSGIEAEHGGALGGVVNVVMKKGSNAYHGSFFTTYESDAMDGAENATLRYDPTPTSIPTGFDNDSQTYSPKRDHFRIAQPGFSVGGPVVKDKLWFFLGFAPAYNSRARTVDFGPGICANIGGCPSQTSGNQYFTQDNQQYFSTARLDYTATQKIRLYGSWLYQYARETGGSLPTADPINSEASYQLNTAIFSPLTLYSHGIGFAAPNATYNVGADITLTPKIVSTTRFGYFFSNYHDFGWPTSSPNLNWNSSGVGALDNAGNPLPTALSQPTGTSTTPYDQSYSLYNASKHYQLNEDVAFFKSGWAGTHNFKFGYQLNHLSNVIAQNGNVPFVGLNVGAGQDHGSGSTLPGAANCGKLILEWGACAGQYGYAVVQDFATTLTKPAVDWNHAFFVQDAWTIGHGLTLNLGLRIEKENLPVPPGLVAAGQTPPNAINFSWSDKIEPRLGAAWGSRNGKLKIFGSYGVVNDVMKLLLAQTSWGAQVFEQCTYALGPDASGSFTNADISSIFVNGRACPNGGPTTPANWAGGVTPPSLVDTATGVSLIENVNLRPWEPVAPGVKPYRQHEIVAGVDYQLSKDWAFEARYDRRRLDHVIEDASLADPNNFEMYTIVNPGQGVNKTINGYANYLQSIGSAFGIPNFSFNSSGTFGTCNCPNNPTAIRNYDGIELRITKTASRGWAGMFSYTYSSLWGNYTGLTTTDQIDGGTTGRNSPDTTRAFDEPYYYFGANGKSNNGPLPTDRPNTFKGNAYYNLPWKGMTTTFGIFQVGYQGSPMSSFTDVGLSNGGSPFEATYIFGRGKWANVSGPAGNVTFGTPYTRRTPWYTQTDLNVGHAIKVNKNNEHQVLSFSGTLTNLLNQHSVVSYWEGFNSNYFTSQFFPQNPTLCAGFGGNCVAFGGASFYQAVETGYNPTTAANASGLIKNNNYGNPNVWQLSRNIRLGVKFTF